jgi:hypothetical protein
MSASTTVVSTRSFRPRSSLSSHSLPGGAAFSCLITCGPARRTSLTSVGRVRHRPIPWDPAAPPRQRVGDLPAQALVAQPVAVFQVQQPQQRIDRDRRPAQPPVKQRPPGRDEALIIKVGVDRLQSAGSRLASSGSSSSQIVVCGSVSRSTVASNAHGSRRITTVSFNHEPDLAYRRSRRSTPTSSPTSSGASSTGRRQAGRRPGPRRRGRAGRRRRAGPPAGPV